MKRTIHTSDEFIYDVLNNMIHHNEIVLANRDIDGSRSLNNIVNRFKDNFSIERGTDYTVLRKVRSLNANIKYRKVQRR